jgi:hypothetical protein
MSRPNLPIRIAVYAAVLAATVATVAACMVVIEEAIRQPSRTFLPTLALAASAAYACGRVRPLQRLRERWDEHEAARRWREGPARRPAGIELDELLARLARPGRVELVASPTMLNLHRLRPCASCPTRLAVPGGLLCTVCAAVPTAPVIPDTVPDVISQEGTAQP